MHGLNKTIKRYSLIILLLFLIVITSGICTGCINREYDAFKTDFNNTYFSIADSIDGKDVDGSIINLQTKENNENMEKLRILLEDIKNRVPEKYRDQYNQFSEQYQRLIYLRDAYAKWDQLTMDEKSRIFNDVTMIEYYKLTRHDNN
jgi:hypothetical protein